LWLVQIPPRPFLQQTRTSACFVGNDAHYLKTTTEDYLRGEKV
jgi:hypothetical protein